MTLLKWPQILTQLKITQPARGYGLGLLLIFALSSALVAASTSFLMAPTASYSVQGTLDESSAKQLAEEALDAAQIDILTQQRAGATITTAYRYPSSGTNTIAVPTYPGSGATTNKGTYYVTTTYARGFSLVLKANVAVGTSNLQVSRFMQLKGASPAIGDNIRFLGRADRDYAGTSVNSAGDVNNDGIDDILIGATQDKSFWGGNRRGEAYLILGRSIANWTTLIDVNGNFNLNSLSKANQTVRFTGRNLYDWTGYCVSSAGDVNNDGYDDIMIGAYGADGGGSNSGEAYLIMGRSTADWNTLTDASGNFSLSSVSKANQTVRFIGRNAGDGIGYSSTGDVNNDGYDDILIGAYGADGGASNAGEAYVIMGRSTADWNTLTDVSGNFNLDNLSKANQTVRFLGRNADDYLGFSDELTSASTSSTGDVNNDGYDDIVIGAYAADGGGGSSGEVYVIMGRSTADWNTLTDASGNFNLDNMSDANQTVRFIGRNGGDQAGIGAGSAGDVNNDGYDDILISAYAADGGGGQSGEVYVIMGRSTADWNTLTDVSGDFNLDNLSKANQTVRFIGRNASDFVGLSVGSAGDVNNDGYADILIGAFHRSMWASRSGEAYMIMGRSTANWASLTDVNGDFNLDNMSDANQTVRFIGRNLQGGLGISVHSAGDVNNDGYADILLGSDTETGASGGLPAGEAYLFWGRSTASWAALTDASGNFDLDNI